MAPQSFETRLFINNEYVNGRSDETLTIYNPSDDTLVSDKIQSAGETDIDTAVEAAKAAFKGPWGSMLATERAECMFKFAALLLRDAEKLAVLESISMGSAVGTQMMLIQLGAGLFRYYAGWADKITGETIPSNNDTYKIIKYEPLGVCAGIGAWNGSFLFFGWKVAPALAAGNTFIYKPSEKSPLGILAVGSLIKEAGFPPGVINIVNGAGRVGALLASHMQIRKISITGSAASGRKVQEAAAKSNLKRVTLELGGKSPAIIFDDANIENAVANTTHGFLFNTGQVCCVASHTFVHENIAEKYIAAVKAGFEGASATVGDSLWPDTMIGPVADKKQFDRVMSFIESGKKEADLLTGGTRKGDRGNFIEPTIFINPSKDAKIIKEEIFGPVVAIETFKTEEEVIEMANNTNYGLSSCIYTSSISRALRVSNKLEAGSVAINTFFLPAIDTPFGGYKESGIGREGGRNGLLSYLETKTIHINMNN